MIILGISHDLWISSAAIVIDGKVVAATSEERLTRIKKFKGFPSKSIDFCLNTAKIRLEDIDKVIIGWNPIWHMESYHPRFSSQSRWRPEYLYSIPNNLLQKSANFPSGPIKQVFGGLDIEIIYIDHHIAHASCSYYLSHFNESAFLVLDGQGERHTGTFGYFKENNLEVIDKVDYPHSLGLFYGMITQFLGFQPDSDEWKVMALASYGSAKDNKFYDLIDSMIKVNNHGIFTIDQQYVGYAHPDVHGGKYFSKYFEKNIGISKRDKNDPILKDHYNLAWACQKVFEKTVNRMLNVLSKKTKSKNIVVSGGCFMNSVYNGKILNETPFENLYIGSCPDDSGISIGAALWGFYDKNQKSKRISHDHNYWGPSFDNKIEETIKKYKISFEKIKNPSKKAAELISEGKIIGWFQGKMEFGQRALGNRSILADPRNKDSKDLVNLAVKYRESFRPFAPSILFECVEDYFHSHGDNDVSFMEKVYQFKEEKKSVVPAVVHIDGTGRLQSVTEISNPRYYQLIKTFNEITGVPIVLNTSFNLNGEAIVCNPTDAIRTFFSCGLDYLILGDYLVKK